MMSAGDSRSAARKSARKTPDRVRLARDARHFLGETESMPRQRLVIAADPHGQLIYPAACRAST